MKLLIIFLIFSSYLCLKADNSEELKRERDKNLKEFVKGIPELAHTLSSLKRIPTMSKIIETINTIPELKKFIKALGKKEIKNQKDLIHYFAESQKVDLLLYLVDKKLADINHLDSMKGSVIDKALERATPTYLRYDKIPETFSKIINHKDYNIHLESNGRNAFEKVLANKRMDNLIKKQLIKIALDRGFDPLRLNANGNNLLFHISDKISLDYFIERYGLDLNHKNKQGNTLLMHHIKEKSNNLDLLKYIADHPQLDKNLVDSNYKSYLDLIKENYKPRKITISEWIDVQPIPKNKETKEIRSSLSKRFTKKHQSTVRFIPTKEQKTYLRNKARALFKSLQQSIRPLIPAKGR